MSESFITSDGLSLAYDVRGEGPPLLCLAGLTRNMADFATVADRFSDRARIVRLDSRGRGQSDFDPDWRNYTLGREAGDVLELMDHLGLQEAAILGTSRGGLLALTLAAAHADRLTGVAFVDIGPVIDAGGLGKIMVHLGRAPAFKSYDEAAEQLGHLMAPGFAGVSEAAWRAHAERLWAEGPGGLTLRYDPRLRDAVLEAAEAAPAQDAWPLFDLLAGKPLALIRGANSDLLSEETAAEMRRRRPDMIYADVPDRGHVPFLDEPESERAIAEFLDQIERGRQA